MARTHRSSVRPVGTTGLYQASIAFAFCVYFGEVTTRSGLPYSFSKFQPSVAGHSIGFGMSLASPFGAPAATHFTTVSISLSESERSFSKSWMPSDLSMCQGGICRVCTRSRIDRAHGRDCS